MSFVMENLREEGKMQKMAWRCLSFFFLVRTHLTRFFRVSIGQLPASEVDLDLEQKQSRVLPPVIMGQCSACTKSMEKPVKRNSCQHDKSNKHQDSLGISAFFLRNLLHSFIRSILG